MNIVISIWAILREKKTKWKLWQFATHKMYTPAILTHNILRPTWNFQNAESKGFNLVVECSFPIFLKTNSFLGIVQVQLTRKIAAN